MKKYIGILFILILIIVAAGVFVMRLLSHNSVPAQEPVQVQETVQDTSGNTRDVPDVSVIAENLTIPWDIAFLPDETLLVSERSGKLIHIDPLTGESEEIVIPDVRHAGEGGLLGIALHPEFEQNNLLYLYLTSSQGETSINQVVRFRYEDNVLSEREVIIDTIPGALFHNGGRIAFGPDGLLYIATGDARSPDSAQDTSSLAGKILRLNPDGSVPAGNSFGNAVYSYGHRNPQGLTWDNNGRLWSTEHGRSGVLSGLDELNRIEKGANYGWPDSQGDTVVPGTIAPKLHSGADVTWAPASASYWDGSIFFGGLKGETLYEAVLERDRVVELKEHFVGAFGRIRTTVAGPDGMLYLTTSNRDGRGNIREGDDKIIRLNPAQFRE